MAITARIPVIQTQDEALLAIASRIGKLDALSARTAHYVQSRPKESIAFYWDGTATAATAIASVLDDDVDFYRRVEGMEAGPDYVVLIHQADGAEVPLPMGHWLIWNGWDWQVWEPRDFADHWVRVDADDEDQDRDTQLDQEVAS